MESSGAMHAMRPLPIYLGTRCGILRRLLKLRRSAGVKGYWNFRTFVSKVQRSANPKFFPHQQHPRGVYLSRGL